MKAFFYVTNLFQFYVRCCEINAASNQTSAVFDASVGLKRQSKGIVDDINSISDNQMIEHISGQLFNSLIVRLWDQLSTNERLMEVDFQLKDHFKENGPAKLPGNDFEDLGLDLDDFKVEDDEIFGNELNMD